MKSKALAAFALASVLSVSALAPAALAAPPTAETGAETTVQQEQTGRSRGRHGSGQQAAEPENAIGKDAAKEKALADAGVTAEQAGKVKARVSQLEDGTAVYRVRFTADGQTYSYQINAVTGAVVGKSSEAVTESTPSESGGRGRHGRERDGKTTASARETEAAAL